MSALLDLGPIGFVGIAQDRISRRPGGSLRGHLLRRAGLHGGGIREASRRRHLELDSPQRLLGVHVVPRRLTQRLQRGFEPEVVTVERLVAPDRAAQVRHLDVEEHAVAIEPEPARPGVLGEQHVGRHDRLQPIADHLGAVLDGSFQHALHLTDLIPPLTQFLLRDLVGLRRRSLCIRALR
ncbi:MAG: hypothetical protein QM736_18955 [Vicinamibacterales bacterium]